MKLDSMGKRIGLLMILAALLIAVCLFLLSLILDYKGIPFFGIFAEPSSQTRGYMDAALHEWIGISLVIFPLFLCGLVLLLGYGGKIFDWVKYGRNKND